MATEEAIQEMMRRIREALKKAREKAKGGELDQADRDAINGWLDDVSTEITNLYDPQTEPNLDRGDHEYIGDRMRTIEKWLPGYRTAVG